MSLELTYQNHLKHDIADDLLTVAIGKPSQPLMDVRSELIKTAQIIHQTYLGKDLVLCMSAGIDSEAMAEIFLLAEVPFKAVSFNYGRGLNDHDIEGVAEYCNSKGVNHKFIYVDAVDFFESEKYLSYSTEKTRVVNPLTALHLEAIQQIEGVPILAWEPPHLDNNLENGKVIIQLINDYFLGYIRYFEAIQRESVPYFFLHRPECFLGFLKTQTYQNILNGGSEIKDYDLKVSVYKEIGLQAQPRPHKFTGFELLNKYFASPHDLVPPQQTFIKRMEAKQKQPLIESMIYKIPRF